MKPKTAALAAGCALFALPVMAQDQAGSATGTFVGTDGENIGEAQLWDTANGTLVDIEINGLPAEQWVAFHVHENGECDAESNFESAGGHFNPADVDHGYLTETGPHAGDMPNQYVGADGVLRAQVFNPFVRVDDSDSGIQGRALMIHGGTDDYRSQPSGDAGDRIACAVIE